MGEILVKGLGKFRIEGDAPNEQESAAIKEMMGIKKTPTIPVDEPTPTDLLVKTPPPDALRADPTPALTSMTGGAVNRPTAEGVGATIGGAIGAEAGPVGMVAGATIGSAAGSLAFDTADAALRHLTGQGGRGPAGTAEDPLAASRRAVDAGTNEFLWTGGATALIPALRAIKPKLLGVATPEARRLQKISEEMGIPLGAQAVSERGFVKGAGKVLGVFPWIGGPARRGAVATEVALRGKYNNILNTLAPNATLADLGVDLTAGAVNRFGRFKAVAGELYDSFFKKAATLPVKDIFPTQRTIREASKITGRVKAGEVVLKSGERLQSPVPKELDGYIEKLMDLPEHITAEQYRGLQLEFSDIISSMKKGGLDVEKAVRLKKAMELDFNTPDISRLSEEAGTAIVRSLSAANEFYARHITGFKSPTAKRFGRVNKKMFQAGGFEAGSINEDEVFKAVFNSKSPQAVNDLRNLVGPKKFGGAVRKFFETEFDKVINPKTGKFDAKRFGQAIGVGNEGGEQALANMLSGTGVRMKTVKQFIELAERAGTVATPDVSSFIARRMTLGGWKAVLGGIGPFGAAAANPIGGATAILLVRHGAKIISDPAKLKKMVAALDDTLNDKQRRAMILRLGVQLFNAEDEAKERAKKRMQQPRGRLSPKPIGEQ